MFSKCPMVLKYFEDEWEPCAVHWARWGRFDVLAYASETNNLLESFNKILKYCICSLSCLSTLRWPHSPCRI